MKMRNLTAVLEHIMTNTVGMYERKAKCIYKMTCIREHESYRIECREPSCQNRFAVQYRLPGVTLSLHLYFMRDT